MKSATVARRLSVLRGTYQQLAAKGLIAWETAQVIAAVKAPGVQKNSTPSLTERQAISLLEAIPTETLQGIRDLALMSVFFITGCRVSAVVGASVGHLETDGVEHYLHVTEKRNKKRRKILLDAARPVRAYLERAGIGDDKEGPLFRPMKPDGTGLERRHLDRKMPWRLVKKYCRAAGIDPDRLGGRGIGIHSLRKTAINDAIRNGASLYEVREFAGHADIRTTELDFVRRRRTPRWRRGGSTFVSRDARAREPTVLVMPASRTIDGKSSTEPSSSGSGMHDAGPLDLLPIWGVFLATVAAVLLAVEGGFRLGRYRRRRSEQEDRPPVGEMVAATLALLAFLLAFTFGLAASRFDVRKGLVIEEANAIGTTSLRAGLLPEPHRSDVRRLLREYVDVRLEAVQPGKLSRSIGRSEELHARLWAHAVAVGEAADLAPVGAEAGRAAGHAQAPPPAWAGRERVSPPAVARQGRRRDRGLRLRPHQ